MIDTIFDLIDPTKMYFAALSGVLLGVIFYVRHPNKPARLLVTQGMIFYLTFVGLANVNRFLSGSEAFESHLVSGIARWSAFLGVGLAVFMVLRCTEGHCKRTKDT